MNELQLSDNLNQIEMEINYHKNLAGQSIWEIGRRLNHVKENDLVHGQFGKWLEHMNINQRVANQMMKVAREIPNSKTSSNLGLETLYLITTLPEDQKQEQLERAEQGDAPTVRELRELKRQNREQQEMIKALENREPQKEVIEKRVEVAPDDYEQLKRENQSLKLENSTLQEKERIAREGAEYAERERNRILKEREAVNKKSEEYDQLTKDIESLERSKSRALQQITAIKDFRKFEENINELLAKLSPLIYQEDLSALDANGIDRHQYEMLVHKVEDWCHDMHQKLNRLEIKEAEIVE